MLADSEAMFVDALTYLFNLLAERLKYRPYSKQERQLAPHVRQHRRKLRRLYLELIPPLISVSTLVCVTIITLRDSMRTLLSNEDISPSDQPSVGIMLVFSAANLLLDFVNVTCFARADQAIGLMHSASENSDERSVNHWHRSSSRSRRALPDTTGLLPSRSDEKQQERSYLTEATASIQQQQEDDHVDTDASEEGINLNMCSAWTVSEGCTGLYCIMD
jgi:Co/Zn/Cd efflux system component